MLTQSSDSADDALEAAENETLDSARQTGRSLESARQTGRSLESGRQTGRSHEARAQAETPELGAEFQTVLQSMDREVKFQDDLTELIERHRPEDEDAPFLPRPLQKDQGASKPRRNLESYELALQSHFWDRFDVDAVGGPGEPSLEVPRSPREAMGSFNGNLARVRNKLRLACALGDRYMNDEGERRKNTIQLANLEHVVDGKVATA